MRGKKKAAPEGEFRSRMTSVELLDRVRGLGDKPVRENLTMAIWPADYDREMLEMRLFGGAC